MRRPALALALALAAFAALPSFASGAGSWTWPVRGEVITAYRNGSDPYAAGQHRGIDIAAPVGSPVAAASAGTVTWAGVAGTSGLTVSMRTSDGRFELSHLHLSSVAVRKGQVLGEGDHLGEVGVSGRRSDGRPHLHFGVREAGSDHAYHDPLAFLPPPATPAQPEGPRALPAPVPSPARQAPSPAVAPLSAPRPLPAPIRLPASEGRRAPRTRPAPQARPAPRTRPAPDARPVPRAAPAFDRAPRLGPVPGRPAAMARRPSPVSDGGERPVTVPGLAARHAGASTAGARAAAAAKAEHRSARPVAAQPPQALLSAGPGAPSSSSAASDRALAAPARAAATAARGPDLGWLLACVGLVLAGVVLAWPLFTRRVGLARLAAAAMARPLFGRR